MTADNACSPDAPDLSTGCACPHHPWDCHGHPHSCGCVKQHPAESDTPQEGEVWYAKLPDRLGLVELKIHQLTPRTIVFTANGQTPLRCAREDISLVERARTRAQEADLLETIERFKREAPEPPERKKGL